MRRQKSPLLFGTKNNFPSFFLSEKDLAHIYKKAIYYFPVSYLLCYEPKFNLGQTTIADRDQKGKIHLLCEACYDPKMQLAEFRFHARSKVQSLP